MSNTYFNFKQFTVNQERCAMKVCTDACLFGAWASITMSRKSDENFKVLDIGTGTGLLSLMIAQKNKTAIHAVESNALAFQQAGENFKQSPWADRIHVHHSSIQEWKSPGRFDFIISNPPFYENDLKSPDSARNDAMHAGGLSISELMGSVKNLLADNGLVYLLLPLSRMGDAESEGLRNGIHVNERIFIRPSPGKNIFRTILSLSFSRYAAECEWEISIHNENREYTEEFKKLLKDFYLHL